MLSVWNAGRSEKVVDRFGSLHPVGHRVCTSKEHYSVVEREYVHRDKLVFLFRSFGMLHYHCQIMDGMAPEEQFLYDIHCIVTSAMVMFGRLVAGDCIPNDEVNSVDMTIRVQVALLCCLLITLKFEGNDIEGFPAVLMLWSMISSDVLQIPTEVTNEVEIICAFEEQILRSVNVFDIVENNHHRVAIECIVKMESEDLIDRQSANRAIALSFFFVSNTYSEAHTHSQKYDCETMGSAFALATLTCLQQARVIPLPRKRRVALCDMEVARMLMRSVATKPEGFAAAAIGGPLLEFGTWQYKATRPDNIHEAVESLK